MEEVVGRYAPSPSGDLHFGSLLAAVASYCHTRAQDGRWLLRIDDLDTPRVVAGAAARIVETLRAHGLIHDGRVWYQSQRREAYRCAIERLKNCGDAFDCGCTRREAQTGPIGPEGPIYPGTCRDGLLPGRRPHCVRVRVGENPVVIEDQLQGRIAQCLATDVGDFVIRRGDGLAAYQLATVVDDAAQGITEVVRGVDLLMSSPRQRWLQQCLGLPAVAYLHVPILVDAHGRKLGKSTGAAALDRTDCSRSIRRCLALLGHAPPSKRSSVSCEWLLAWACEHWSVARIPRATSLSFDSLVDAAS